MTKRLVAMVLAFLCLFQFLPSVGAFRGNEFANASYIELDELSKRVVREITESREEKSKCFELDNGQIMKIDYPVAVHKLDENGNWQNCFEQNRKNFIEFNADSIRISRNDYEIAVSYENSSKSELTEFNGNHKVYKNIYENVDLEYKILQNKLEENLILNSKDTPKEFIINYSLKGLTAIQIDEKNIELLNENQKCVYKISAPKMYDSNGAICENLSLQILKNEENALRVKMICDKSWIESDQRLFPIFVDPDYTDENFDFTSDTNGKVVATNWRKKDTNTSVFLNLTGSDFKDFGVVTVSVFGRGSGGEMNCTYQTDYYLLEAGRKYELYNSVNEKGCTEVQIRFRTLQGQRICGKWSPDYKPEGGVLRIGGTGGPGNTKDTEFSLVVSPSRTCWTMIRTKANDSSIYLQLLDPSGRGGSVKCSIWGLGGSSGSENRTYKQDSYTLQFGQKYELLNSVKENKHSGVQLRLEGNPGTEIKGKWSPDYVTEPGCIRVPSSKNSVIRRAEGGHLISVQPMTQHCGFPSGCEATSAAMVIHFYGYRPSGHYKNLITDFISKMDIKPAVNGGNGPDPNFAFAGHPTQGGYGCFAPCISKAMERFFKENAKNGCYAEIIRGKNLMQLAKDYTAHNVPILIWATINMTPKGSGNSWKVTYPTNSPLFNKSYTWPAGEHCVVLVGFNERDFFVNDPYQDEGNVIGAYSKSVLETSFESMGSQAIVVKRASEPIFQSIVSKTEQIDIQKEVLKKISDFSKGLALQSSKNAVQPIFLVAGAITQKDLPGLLEHCEVRDIGDQRVYLLGKLTADVGMAAWGAVQTVFGIGEILGGIGLGVGGTTLSGTGVGAVVGVPVLVVSGAALAHGTVVATAGMSVMSSSLGNLGKDLGEFKENRVPLDRETVLGDGTYKPTNKDVQGAKVYEKDGKYYHRDKLHRGKGSHLEVYDKRGNHLGEADIRTGSIKPGTADLRKNLKW